MSFLYLAYGSNMLTERLTARTRCPSAYPVGVAYAVGYALEFSKRSNDGSGKGALVAAPGSRAYGVLFEIADNELGALNRAEGRGYDRDDGFPVRRVDTDEEISAVTYLAGERDASLRPFDWYLALVVAGARQHRLPPEEIAHLASHPHDLDTDEERETRIDAIDALTKAGVGTPAQVLGKVTEAFRLCRLAARLTMALCRGARTTRR
jgi:hypothetical protein